MPYYLVEPWGRDKYHQAAVLFAAATVEAAHAEMDRLVARLVGQQIDPATFEWSFPKREGELRGGRPIGS